MQKEPNPFSTHNLSIQSLLRPALTPVRMNVDYERFRADLEMIDCNLRASSIEALAVEMALENLRDDSTLKQKQRCATFAITALRLEVLRHLLGLPSFRDFSRQLASSDLLADFCRLRTIEGIQGTSKSTLERASKFLNPDQIRELNRLLCEVVSNGDFHPAVGLTDPVDASVCLVDTTCLEANIHFPVDWVLLKDVSLTLLKAIRLIRDKGLKHRMPQSSEELGREMNRLCIEMTHSHRRKDGKKQRKSVLRRMKHLLKKVADHARSHRDLLRREHQRTPLSSGQAEQIVQRIEGKLAQVPEVIHQAHERIIGERLIKNSEKILSVHEPDVHVIVRGKAGKNVEFGNKLFLCESPDGFLLDYELERGRPISDVAMLEKSLERQQSFDIDQRIESVVGDRGFNSKAGSQRLNLMGIADETCPRDPMELRDRLKDASFVERQRRRGSTEARIAILTNQAKGGLRAKGFTHRSISVGWAVLGHNFWWIARKVREKPIEDAEAA